MRGKRANGEDASATHVESRRRRGFTSRLFFALAYAAYLLLWLIGVHYFFFWRPFIAELRERRKPPYAEVQAPPQVDRKTALRLGDVQIWRRTSFVHFATEKPAATTRICALGDSYTYGDETADGNEYPALLDRQLRRAGFAGIEVINFGSGWHGFHQTYMMWDSVARRFGCDYVLLGPGSFQYHRDTAFNHTQLEAPYYVHARYVLDGDDVRLVEVLGDTYAERFAEYLSYLPRWQYLRFDRNLAPVVQAVLPAGRTLPNPFYYYQGSAQAEALATEEILLRRLGDTAPRVVVLHDNDALLEVLRRMGKANVVAARAHTMSTFPYRAGEGHYSADGNQLVAQQFFNSLVRDADQHLTLIETEDPHSESPIDGAPPPPLSSFDRVTLHSGDAEIGLLVKVRPLSHEARETTATELKRDGVNGLLAIKGPKTSWLDASYAGVDFPLRHGAEVVVRCTSGSTVRQATLGTLRLVHPQANLGVVDVENAWFGGDKGFVFAGHSTLALADLGQPGSICEMRIGENIAMSGRLEAETLQLDPKNGVVRGFRAVPTQFLDVDNAPAAGVVDLVVEPTSATPLRAPIATWRKASIAGEAPDPPLPGRLAPRGTS